MSGQAATATRAEGWSEVLRVASRAGNERALLRAVLRQVAAEAGSEGATLVFESSAGRPREVVVGAPPGEGDGSPRRVSLPDGELRLDSAAEAEPSSVTLAALTIAIQAFVLGERVKEQSFAAAYRGVEREALYEVGLAIAGTLNADELSEEILLRAVSLLDARRGALYLAENGDLVLNRTFGGDARPRVPVDAPEVGALIESGQGELDLLPGSAHLLAVPIELEGSRKGLLLVGDKESRQGVGPFASADRRTLSLFANQAAIALENAHLHRQALEKERMERETELAADIQRRLLPDSVPEIEGLEIVGWNRPARLVGGDYYGLLPQSSKKLVSVVGDVTGKGMPAALLVSNLHSALHLLLEQEWVGPVLFERLNRHILESSTINKFITLFLAEIDGPAGRVRYLNAGHNFPILLRADGEALELTTAGMPLGLFPGAEYQVDELEMEPGDLLCCYSDGITECASPDDEEFGTERLTALLEQHRGRPLTELLESIEAAVEDFAAGAPQGDDQTIVLIRRSG